jgi:hypothetical protein
MQKDLDEPNPTTTDVATATNTASNAIRGGVTRGSDVSDFDIDFCEMDSVSITGKSVNFPSVYGSTSTCSGGKPRSLKNKTNPDPTPELPLKLSTTVVPRPFLAPFSPKSTRHATNTKGVTSFHQHQQPAASVSVEPSLTATSAGVSVGMSEDSSYLDGKSSSSYLTEYDADYLLESIRNIKMFYSRKDMNQIHATAPSGNVGSTTAVPGRGGAAVPAPMPLPPTEIRSSKANPKMNYYTARSPRGTGTFEHTAHSAATTTATNVLATSPIRTDGSAQNKAQKPKNYSKIDPESTPKLNFVANPSKLLRRCTLVVSV